MTEENRVVEVTSPFLQKTMQAIEFRDYEKLLEVGEEINKSIVFENRTDMAELLFLVADRLQFCPEDHQKHKECLESAIKFFYRFVRSVDEGQPLSQKALNAWDSALCDLPQMRRLEIYLGSLDTGKACVEVLCQKRLVSVMKEVLQKNEASLDEKIIERYGNYATAQICKSNENSTMPISFDRQKQREIWDQQQGEIEDLYLKATQRFSTLRRVDMLMNSWQRCRSGHFRDKIFSALVVAATMEKNVDHRFSTLEKIFLGFQDRMSRPFSGEKPSSIELDLHPFVVGSAIETALSSETSLKKTERLVQVMGWMKGSAGERKEVFDAFIRRAKETRKDALNGFYVKDIEICVCENLITAYRRGASYATTPSQRRQIVRGMLLTMLTHERISSVPVPMEWYVTAMEVVADQKGYERQEKQIGARCAQILERLQPFERIRRYMSLDADCKSQLFRQSVVEGALADVELLLDQVPSREKWESLRDVCAKMARLAEKTPEEDSAVDLWARCVGLLDKTGQKNVYEWTQNRDTHGEVWSIRNRATAELSKMERAEEPTKPTPAQVRAVIQKLEQNRR